MNIAILKQELLDDHPDTGPYNADNALATIELNVENRSSNKKTMTASEVYNAVDVPEYEALGADDKLEIWNIIHIGEINPFGLEATRFTSIFGGGSVTIVALAAGRKISVSRAVELELGLIKEGHVFEARK